MAYSLIAAAAGSTGSNSNASLSFNTTGANIIFLVVSTISVTPTITDSNSNTYTLLTSYASASGNKVFLYYCYAPTVGSGHNISAGGASTFPGLTAAAFSGATSSPFETQTGQNPGSTSTTIQPGSITPLQNGEILITGVTMNPGPSSLTIDSGFTIAATSPFTGGSNFGASLAYLIQTTSSAVNPTWSSGGTSMNWTATMASFKAAATAAPSGDALWFGMTF